MTKQDLIVELRRLADTYYHKANEAHKTKDHAREFAYSEAFCDIHGLLCREATEWCEGWNKVLDHLEKVKTA